MRVLSIESSCDETAAAVVSFTDDGHSDVRADVVHSQTDVHAPYGGVVPELASRDHLARVLPVVDRALTQAGCGLPEIDLFAVTSGPGLVGALLVGVQAAKALAWSLGKPCVGTNHLVGHALAITLSEERPDGPYVALVASGGHTSLYDVASPVEITPLGHTLDDAAGEAFDKVGKMLGLEYPAGARIDRLASTGDRTRFEFPRGLRMKSSLDFSFSGVKTAVLTHLEKHGAPEGQDLADTCASFQEAVCDSLVTKLVAAARDRGRDAIAIGGGVAANSRLRALVVERASRAGLRAFVPPRALCTDNAAMIAVAGYHRFRHRGADSWDLNADAAWRP